MIGKLASASLFLAATAGAGQPTYSVSDTVTNKRVSLGMTLDGPTRQAEVDVFFANGLSFFGLGNYQYDHSRWNDHEWGFDYERHFGPLRVSGGYEQIHLPYSDIQRTQDIHGFVAAGPVKFMAYRDFEKLNGTYVSLSAEKQAAGFNMKGEVGCSDHFLRDGHDMALSHAGGFVSRDFNYGDLTFTATVGGTLKIANDGLYDNSLVFRVNLTREFGN